MAMDGWLWQLAPLALLAGAWLATHASLRRHARSVDRELAAIRSDFQTLKRDFRALCAGATQVGDRLAEVDRRARKLLSEHERVPVSGDARKFEHAAALLDRGGSVDELVHLCGMSQGEAEMVAFVCASETGTVDSGAGGFFQH